MAGLGSLEISLPKRQSDSLNLSSRWIRIYVFTLIGEGSADGETLEDLYTWGSEI